MTTNAVSVIDAATAKLVNSVLIDSFLLVETGKGTVVTFIKSPGLSDRDPELV